LKTQVPKDYAYRIKNLRKKNDLTQTGLAERLGVSFASINRWENEQAKPNGLAWRKIERAEVLGLQAFDEGPVHAVREDKQGYAVVSAKVPDLDFTTPPEIILTVAEGYRLAFGHQYNPAFATETSIIDPLPHQRIAVYEHMLPQPRLRFLLADDAGAGKTIMAGLYIREMLARRLIHRVLVVPPAGLVGNWEREMRTLFGLHFQIISGSDARDGNPFVGSDSHWLIVSIDTLAADRTFARLQEPQVQPYDLVIFDEAHKLSADREPDFHVRKTDRYRLAEAIAGIRSDQPRWQLTWSTQHLMLLTATPHMGKDYPYYCLWRLLEPEALSTFDAFNGYPADARTRHFIRRTKEEMVRYDGTPIYPTRISATLSYELTSGSISEQELYDRATAYIEYTYNRARILNRSAARLAMSIFQRRLASSTWALKCSLGRRLEKLNGLMDDIRSGKITPQQLQSRQRKLDTEVRDVLEETTADEEGVPPEGTLDGKEEHEASEDQALAGVVATSLAELEAEAIQVSDILTIANQVYEAGHESKFEKLLEVLRDPNYKDEKLIIFTEHRDTLNFLVRRLEGMGFTGQIVQIHGGMDYRHREEAVASFRKPLSAGGVKYLVATDAAGEGINLQVCWLMVNYDIPWNPARLEQRLGRIHRYGQQHDPVIILNLVAGRTREGRVMRTLLEKLERIRKELRSDKVFDVVGRLFEGVSLRAYLEQAATEEGAEQALQALEGSLTAEQVRAIQEREKKLFGDGGDVKRLLPRLQKDLELETYRRLLPGYVRNFFEHALPLLDLGVDGDLSQTFSLRPLKPGAFDLLWPILESYPPEQRNRFTFSRPADAEPAIFLHPGEPFFDTFLGYITYSFAQQALSGGVFVDVTANTPYLFHLAEISIIRKADPQIPTLAQAESIETRLVALREGAGGKMQSCPVESLLLLRGGKEVPAQALSIASGAQARLPNGEDYLLTQVLNPLVTGRQQALLRELPERENFIKRGYAFQEAELAAARARYTEKANGGDPNARGELTRIKERQKSLSTQRDSALAALRREPELITSNPVIFLAHALVVPSNDPEDVKQRDDRIEAIAMQVAIAYEEANGPVVKDVHTPELAHAVGLGDFPGFDLFSRRPDGSERAIEVKGRAQTGDIDISANEWSTAINLGNRYWLYIVLYCVSSQPQLIKINDPVRNLLASARGFVLDLAGILKFADQP
jgi:superfamily II DNA or RNA helicase/DNA-binding XRE family transcriptional regulator